MQGLYLWVGVSLLCISVSLGTAQADTLGTTEPASLLDRAKGKVKDLISKVRQPSPSGSGKTNPTPPSAGASSGGTGGKLKETIKKVRKSEIIKILTTWVYL